MTGGVGFVGRDHEAWMLLRRRMHPRHAISDQRDSADMHEPTLPNDNDDSAEAADPADPTDRIEPTLPIDRIE